MVRIILNGNIQDQERTARLQHLTELMVQASSFKWPAVRALYGVALKEIRRGVRRWSDPLCDIKDEMLKPGDVLTIKNTTVPSNSICTQWNYNRDGCPRGQDCGFEHICKECDRHRHREERHRARVCPHKPGTAKKSGHNQDEEEED